MEAHKENTVNPYNNQLESGAYICLHSNEDRHKMETSLLYCSLSMYNLELFSIEKMFLTC